MRRFMGISKRVGGASRRALVVLLGVCLVVGAHAAAPAQRSFAAPEDAAAALIKALKARDDAGALAILGPGSEQWIRSGDAVADRAARARFVALYEQRQAIEKVTDQRVLLTLGPDAWPFAFPLVKSESGWHFDTAAGKRELLYRRVGQNELNAINVLLAIVDAQRDYAAADHDRDEVREYARVFASNPGKHDGLYWPTTGAEPASPLGELVVRASAEGYSKGKDKASPYHGYYFRMLLGQGPHAAGGALDYIVQGHMIGGFAAMAYPAQYANSGVMTFIVNHDGVVYQKDLGAASATVAPGITRFDPGPGWTKVE